MTLEELADLAETEPSAVINLWLPIRPMDTLHERIKEARAILSGLCHFKEGHNTVANFIVDIADAQPAYCALWLGGMRPTMNLNYTTRRVSPE